MTTYSCLKYHIVFGTRHRRSLLLPRIRLDLYSYIGGIIKGEGGNLDAIGGVEDHIHILAGIPPRIAVSDMLRCIKAATSPGFQTVPLDTADCETSAHAHPPLSRRAC